MAKKTTRAKKKKAGSWGGSRSGSGRPANHDEPMTQVSFYLPASSIAYLDAKTSDTVSRSQALMKILKRLAARS